MPADRPITSAQRLAARALKVALPEPDTDPHTKAEQALAEAAKKPPAGWTTGGVKDVINSGRRAVEARRKRTT